MASALSSEERLAIQRWKALALTSGLITLANASCSAPQSRSPSSCSCPSPQPGGPVTTEKGTAKRPNPHRRTSQTNQMRSESVDQGLPPLSRRGVSLAYLKKLCDSIKAIPELPDGTEGVVARVIVPITRHLCNKSPFWALVPPNATGKPDYYVVHTWGASFQGTVQQVLRFLMPVPEPSKPPPPSIDPDRVYVWLDFIAVCQHTALNIPPTDIEQVRDTVAGCSQGSLVVLDPELVMMTRLWCMYEMWATVYYGDCTKLHVLFPDNMDINYMSHFQTLCSQLVLSKGEASKADDKQRIISEVKKAVGVKRMQMTLQESLVRSARAKLRWSGSLNDLATYCALLIENSDFNGLQRTLSSIDELATDEKTLQEVREIFTMYDTDGSGELDKDEFIEVLGVAGFNGEEAERIFTHVNSDGVGGVSLEEFEQWWIESQRQQAAKGQRVVDMTGEALLNNINSMAQLLERQGLNAQADFFRDIASQMASGKLIKQMKAELPAVPIQGNWRGLADQVAWKVHAGALREAGKILYTLLMWNADALECNPIELPLPGAPRNAKEQAKTVATYLEAFGQILRRQPACRKLGDAFCKSAMELRNQANGIAMNHRKGKKKDVKKAKGWYKYDVVREMIHIKYGADQQLNKMLIEEAELSLSTWMATNRKTKKYEDSVSAFARSYLGVIEKEEDPYALPPIKQNNTGGNGRSTSLATASAGATHLPDPFKRSATC